MSVAAHKVVFGKPTTHTHPMKLSLVFTLATLAASLTAAVKPTTVSFEAGGNTKVMTSVAPSAAVMKTEADSFTYDMVQVDPLAVLVDVRPTASTQVVALGQASQKFAAAADAQVRWKAVNALRTPGDKAGFICAAASKPPTTLALDTLRVPGHIDANTPQAWRAPASDALALIEEGQPDVSQS